MNFLYIYSMEQNGNQLTPTAQEKRIISLDLLRGIAVLGILIVNMQSFSMIEAAYLNPTAYGDLTGLNRQVWLFVHVFGDQKFLALFSMLFGAGIVLFTEKLEANGQRVAGIYYSRLFWLLVFGLIHAYLFWYGDILVSYAISGALVYPLRRWKVRGLFTLGFALMAIPAFNYWLFGTSMQYWPPEAVDELLQSWKPDAATIAKEIETMTGGWVEQIIWRAKTTWKMQTFVYAILLGWKTAGLMLVGMGLYKSGIIIAKKSNLFYFLMGLIGLGVGLSLIIQGVNKNFEVGWTVQYSMFLGWEWNYIGSFFLSLFYLSVVMFWARTDVFVRAQNILAAAGRMAFSNYILTTIICVIFFNGFGFLGKVDRIGQMVMVVVVWIILLLFSKIWLHYYKFGPLEWMWRSLTYKKKLSNTSDNQ